MQAKLMVVVLAATMVLSVPSLRAESEQDMQLAKMARFIDLMNGHLTLTSHWMELLGDEDTAAYLVAEGIAELHKEVGNALAACPELEEMLANPRIGAKGKLAIRFKLRDIYKEAGQPVKALEQLRAIGDSLGRQRLTTPAAARHD